MKKLIFILIMIPLAGCTSTPRIIRELAKDPATAHFRVTTIYGTIEVTRVNATTNSMPHEIKADGTVSVKQ